MTKLDFNEQAKQVENLYQEAEEILETRTEQEIQKLVNSLQEYWAKYEQQTKLSIAFIGQYNAGKSTIIKALSGDDTVRISAEVCTDKISEYSWQDVLLLDTPGIYAGRIDHDEITLDKISKCDLLIFVVPNELFNPQAGAFFKKVAEEMQRVGQMILVVNKMSRESGTPEALLTTIMKVIEPHHPDDFSTCFIDADSYLKAQEPKYAKYQAVLQAKSNLDDFKLRLHNLINRKKILVKLATRLRVADEALEQARNFLSTNDKTTHDLLEILRRKSRLFSASQTRFRNAYQTELNKLEYEIIMLGETVASKIDGHHSEDEIRIEIEKVEEKINSTSAKILEKIQSALQSEIARLQAKLEELQNSSLGRSLAQELEIPLVDGKEFDSKDIGQKCGGSPFVIKGAKLFKEVGFFASKVSRDLVYGIGKSIGIKFKPWGAVNTAKFIKGLGPIISVVGVGLDIFMTAKQEQEEADFQEKLRQVKAKMRQDFRNAASKMREDYEVKIEETISFYEEEIQDIERKQKDLSNTEQLKVEIVSKIDSKRQEIKEEIRQLIK